MYIEISLSRSRPGPGTVALREPDDFRSLKVVVHDESGTRDGLDEALAQVGRLAADGDAILRIDALRRLAHERARSTEWSESFDAMVQYAYSRGWMADDGAALQAHCEWRGPASWSR